MNIAHLLQRQARIATEQPAIFKGIQGVATYGQWAQRCQHLARQFQAAGLQPGDRVALFMRNHVRYLEVMFAAWWAGLVVVPINAKLHLREAQWIVDNAQAS
ncbi:MAG: acyl--CoA ligase, partial [Hydrogenophaga sp.]|nr:acyl--CoA ligase [Hydrogenophaga sp.]